jgi:hypothetical protein
MEASTPRISIRDNGELGEIRDILDQLDMEYEEAEKGSESPLPTHLLISSGTRAMETLSEISKRAATHRLLHFVILEQPTRTQLALLQRHGCDVVARRPIHPDVLRLLVQRALFAGQEKRISQRVAIGCPIKLKSGLFARTVTLTELSLRACRLITKQALKPDRDVSVVLPNRLSESNPIALSGRVVSVHREPQSKDGEWSVAVAFTGLTRTLRQSVQGFMKLHAIGQTGHLDLAPGTELVADSAVTQSPSEGVDAETQPESNRRGARRSSYDDTILARDDTAVYSLVGRDLSTGGMLVAPEPGLEVGTTLRLAIYGSAGVKPVVVSARVLRDDRDAGLAIGFDPPNPIETIRLESIVEKLDDLLGEGRGSSVAGTVVSEVLQD